VCIHTHVKKNAKTYNYECRQAGGKIVKGSCSFGTTITSIYNYGYTYIHVIYIHIHIYIYPCMQKNQYHIELRVLPGRRKVVKEKRKKVVKGGSLETCTYVQAYVFTCIRVYIRVCSYLSNMYTDIYLCNMYIYIYRYIHIVCKRVYIRVCIHLSNIYTYIYPCNTYISMYRDTHIFM